MAEWSKALAWKVSIRQNRIEGSNPSRSASCFSSLFRTLPQARAVFGLVCSLSLMLQLMAIVRVRMAAARMHHTDAAGRHRFILEL